eukprot:jgi/Mesvir1/22389/Mv17880-RA.1
MDTPACNRIAWKWVAITAYLLYLTGIATYGKCHPEPEARQQQLCPAPQGEPTAAGCAEATSSRKPSGASGHATNRPYCVSGETVQLQPGLIGLGVGKGGSTSLAELLAANLPWIHFAPREEIHFFDVPWWIPAPIYRHLLGGGGALTPEWRSHLYKLYVFLLDVPPPPTAGGGVGSSRGPGKPQGGEGLSGGNDDGSSQGKGGEDDDDGCGPLTYSDAQDFTCGQACMRAWEASRQFRGEASIPIRADGSQHFHGEAASGRQAVVARGDSRADASGNRESRDGIGSKRADASGSEIKDASSELLHASSNGGPDARITAAATTTTTTTATTTTTTTSSSSSSSSNTHDNPPSMPPLTHVPPDVIAFEKSPGYFHRPDSPWAMRQLLPHAFTSLKFLLLVRDPVSRAYSSYFQHWNADPAGFLEYVTREVEVLEECFFPHAILSDDTWTEGVLASDKVVSYTKVGGNLKSDTNGAETLAGDGGAGEESEAHKKAPAKGRLPSPAACARINAARRSDALAMCARDLNVRRALDTVARGWGAESEGPPADNGRQPTQHGDGPLHESMGLPCKEAVECSSRGSRHALLDSERGKHGQPGQEGQGDPEEARASPEKGQRAHEGQHKLEGQVGPAEGRRKLEGAAMRQRRPFLEWRQTHQAYPPDRANATQVDLFRHCGVVIDGLYAESLANYLCAGFRPDQFLILSTGELSEDPVGVLRRVAAFVGRPWDPGAGVGANDSRGAAEGADAGGVATAGMHMGGNVSVGAGGKSGGVVGTGARGDDCASEGCTGGPGSVKAFHLNRKAAGAMPAEAEALLEAFYAPHNQRFLEMVIGNGFHVNAEYLRREMEGRRRKAAGSRS